MSMWTARCDDCPFFRPGWSTWLSGKQAAQTHFMATGHVTMLVQDDGAILATFKKKRRKRAAGKTALERKEKG